MGRISESVQDAVAEGKPAKLGMHSIARLVSDLASIDTATFPSR